MTRSFSTAPRLKSLTYVFRDADMGAPDDGQDLTGMITSGSYELEEKRRRRDELVRITGEKVKDV